MYYLYTRVEKVITPCWHPGPKKNKYVITRISYRKLVQEQVLVLRSTCIPVLRVKANNSI
jgi:hypothetical protein